jgi:bifunctional non-homologous end joining protein LigD
MPGEYGEKRDFTKTPEPEMQVRQGDGPLTFVIQKHAATSLHYDLRLELDGALLSWAVPKGPSLNPNEKRLAMMVEDHPLDYASFEGVIPAGNYGAGEVIVWDNGIYTPDEDGRMLFYDRDEAQKEMRKGLDKGKISVFLRGTKLKGSWALVRLKGKEREWLFFKHNDEFADSVRNVLTDDKSVISGLTIDDLKAGKLPAAAPHSSSAVTAASLPGAIASELPTNPVPMAAGTAAGPFSDPEWIFEPKLDGVRALACIRKGSVKLITRNGNDVSRRYPKLVEGLSKQIAEELLLDGEIVALDAKGRPSFHLLQQRMHLDRDTDIRLADSSVPVYFYAFDVLHCDGYDLTGCPLIDRKRFLGKALMPNERVSAVEFFEEHGEAAFDAIKKLGMEGIVAKKRASRYEMGKRSNSWLKIKTQLSEEFVIGGYSEGLGSRAATFGALLLGTVGESGKLTYVGHVGSGFDDQTLEEYREKFAALETTNMPFESKPPLKTPAKWLKPELVAEVKFAEWTPDGHLRAPVFLRLREDLSPENVHKTEIVSTPAAAHLPENLRRMQEKTAEDAAEQIRAGKRDFSIVCEGHEIAITNPDKTLWPETQSRRALTKRDLLVYYAEVSQYLLPHLRDRPLTLSRYPNGIEGGMFYQKHWEHKLPAFVEPVQLFSEHNLGDQEYIACNNLPTLLWLGQLADLELHPWTSRTNPEPDAHDYSIEFTGSQENIDRSVLNYPDYLLFDLDPYIYSGEEATGAEPEFNRAAFDKGREVALWLKEILDSLSLTSFVKTSGKTGLHIYVPILRQYTYDQVRALAATICNFILQKHSDDVTTEWAVVKRTGKIFLDYNQNSRGKTLSSIYSPRALRDATVSFPISWSELPGVLPNQFDILTVPGILNESGDPWKGILKSKNDLRRLIEG